MADATGPASLASAPEGYGEWLADLMARVAGAQQRAARAVNTELVTLYWHIGRETLEKQGREGWGTKVIDRLSHDLRDHFPEMKGLSRTNLLYMRAFAKAWPDPSQIVQAPLGQLTWYHQLALLDKLDTAERRMAYAVAAVEHGWSRNVLVMHDDDAPTLGMLLCQAKNGVVAEYALRGSAGPLGVAEYELLKDLPEPLATSLPTIEQIERELSPAADPSRVSAP